MCAWLRGALLLQGCAHMAAALGMQFVGAALTGQEPDPAAGVDMPRGEYNFRGYMDINRTMREYVQRVRFEDGTALARESDDVNTIAKHFKDRVYLNMNIPRVASIRFNPSMVVLPAKLRQRFGNGAHYLATLRHIDGQCRRLGNGSVRSRDTCRWGVCFSSLVLFRKDFSAIAAGGFEGVDARLLVDGDTVYLSRTMGDAQMHFSTLDIDMSGDTGLDVKLSELDHFEGRNLGFLKYDGHFVMLKWISKRLDMGSLLVGSGAGDKERILHLHNSINPVYLPEHDVFLGVGHAHLEDKCPGCGKFGPKYGWRYVNMFFLFEKGYPWKVKRWSSPFCIPSALDSSKCETIQFITSILREGKELILTYGINDCEAAAIRVPLKAVLEFTDVGAGVPGVLLETSRAHS